MYILKIYTLRVVENREEVLVQRPIMGKGVKIGHKMQGLCHNIPVPEHMQTPNLYIIVKN